MLSCPWSRLAILILSAASVAFLPTTARFAALMALVGLIVIWLLAERVHAFAERNGVERPYHEMTDRELRRAHRMWSARAAESSSWAALLFASRQVEVIAMEISCREGRPHQR
jgi:hypothetical protein